MAQGRSTKIIKMIKWIRTIRLSIKNSLSKGLRCPPGKHGHDLGGARLRIHVPEEPHRPLSEPACRV